MESATLEYFPTKEAARSRLSKLDLEEPALSFLGTTEDELPGGSILESARLLIGSDFLNDACNVLAQALTRRAAVWWACCAARDEVGGGPTEKELPALERGEEPRTSESVCCTRSFRRYRSGVSLRLCCLSSVSGG